MNYSHLNLNYANLKRQSENERINEVAKAAAEFQRQGMARTEALKTAERLIPHR